MSTTPVLSREAFLKSSPLRRERVEVPALGGAVFVRQITAGELDEFEFAMAKLSRRDRRGQQRARTVLLVACDAEGRPMFGEADVEALAGKAMSELEPILRAHVRLNVFTAAEADELGKD